MTVNHEIGDVGIRAGSHDATEKRAYTRFAIRGKVRFEWATSDGQRVEGVGVTRNVCRTGAFVETQRLPDCSAPMKVRLTLSTSSNSAIQIRLCGEGAVRHVVSDSKRRRGFGVWVVFRNERFSKDVRRRPKGTNLSDALAHKCTKVAAGTVCDPMHGSK
jgi:hypothetical protein